MTSCMDDNGIFTNYRLNIETQKDEHYQIIPEKIQDLLKLLKAEMSDEYFPNPAVACARYLSEHPVKDLTALLEKHDFLLFEHRKKDVAVIDSLANIFTSEKIERVFQTLEKLGFVLEKTEGNSELTSLLFSNNKNEKLDLGIEFKDEDILLYYNIYYTGEMLAQVCRILELLNEEAEKKRRFYLLG